MWWRQGWGRGDASPLRSGPIRRNWQSVYHHPHLGGGVRGEMQGEGERAAQSGGGALCGGGWGALHRGPISDFTKLLISQGWRIRASHQRAPNSAALPGTGQPVPKV